MGAHDDTPAKSAAQMAERDHFVLKGVSVAVNDLTKEVRGYRDDATAISAELKEHIKSCDRRYGEMRDARRGDAPGPDFARPLVKKIIDKGIDYVVFAIVMLLIFAFKHGATLPLPSP